MREIKFRAWSKKTKKLYKVLRLHINDYDPIWATCERFCPFQYKNIHHDIQPKDCVIMEFTGLKDKNGVEIYEGDICIHNGKIAQIVFWEGAFIFNMYYIHDYSLTNFACCRTFEVIGNIYENPGLL